MYDAPSEPSDNDNVIRKPRVSTLPLTCWNVLEGQASIVQARLVGLAHFSIGYGYVLTYGLNGLGHPSYCWAACRK